MRVRGRTLLGAAVASLILLGIPVHGDGPEQNWTHYVRIGGYGLNGKDADKIVRDAEAAHVFGIEVDNDIPGRYESFLDPTAKLAAIKAVAEKAHAVKNKAFVYVAGTECITANSDKAAHSVVKDHPDWLQRKLTGEPAVFTGGAAFWIRKGDEDVWISPYAQPWRKMYMERVRQIAATGIDGIYVDIPYWMTHFDGWENTWASYDDFTVAAFKAKTGLDARKDLKIGDFKDANFRKWVNFRIDTLTDFVAEIRTVARGVNPAIMVIPEIYPGIEQEATRVGADVYEMYAVVDAIAHEYEFGSGDHMAAGRTQVDWFLYQAGMLTFRAFAEGKASWILNYSWDGDKGVDAKEAMKTLAASQIITGVNFWDAPGHSMGGSNDIPTRAEIFKWIAAHEKTFYLPRTPMHPVGVYFSPASRNFDSERFLAAYRGTLVLLLQSHVEFQPVTPRTLSGFKGSSLILADVSVLDDAEKAKLKQFVASGGKLIITGADDTGLGKTDNVQRFEVSPGAAHLAALQKDFVKAAEAGQPGFNAALPKDDSLVVQTAPTVASNVALVDGKPHIFLGNFGGIVPHSKVNPAPETATRISVHASRKCTASFLPFLGEVKELKGTVVGDRLVFYLPPVGRAAVVWITDTK